DVIEKTIPVFNQWFGKYPGTQFTIAEACFGWNGNECGGLVLIDDRMFNMPHIAKGYPLYLVQHELCHQWFYNAIGSNGYSETWMDEGLATYFGHRVADQMWGKNNQVIHYPTGLKWLPNIRRDDLRYYCMIGAWARGDANPPLQELPKFGHLVNLTSSVYDRGGKVVGLIEERLGEQEFLKFMQHLYGKYKYRICLAADFQRELEEYTHHSWEDFFQFWLHGTGQCDWAVDRVEIDEKRASLVRLPRWHRREEPVRVTVYLKQQGDFNEPTTLGIRLIDGNDYQVRIPIQPDIVAMPIDDLHAFVTCSTEQVGNKQKALVKVEISLPSEPLQITVDPDRVLIDQAPVNNYWKREFRYRMTPFYTQLDEVDVTNSFDRWNMTAGPWLYFASYNDPWYTRSLMGGLRLGLYRTQTLQTAAYLAYRSNDRNIIAGADMLWDHAILPKTQIGMSIEKSLATISTNDIPTSRAAVFLRHVMMYGSSLYLPPFEYVEGFGVMQNRSLPNPDVSPPGSDLFRDRTAVGLHYHKNLLTPYWDAEGGFMLDVSGQYGIPIFGTNHDFQLLYGQFSWVKSTPKFGEGPIANWLNETRWAFRVGGAAGLPNNGQFFSLGGGDNFRGFDLAQRQGSMVWLGSVEWRVPLWTNLHIDLLDHVAGVRNIYVAPFYDIGNAYLMNRELGPTAQAVGAGLRVDVTWLGMIERTMLRFDVAQTISGNYPVQFWVGIQHPF
ncbi:MAG TPA: M1 family aminopeptidase, partial [Gemmataceae bacterium]|nr:M1 family aminopeptidase [Gemmataceae bacterium]